MHKTDKWLLAIAAIYAAALLAVLAVFGYTPGNDTDGYISMAQTCLDEGEPYPCMKLINSFPFIWNVGSINIIAASIRLTGSVLPLLPIFCLLKALTALLTAKICGRLMGGRAAVATMLLYVLYPNNWGQSTMLLSELPMVFFCTWGVYTATGKPTTARLVVSGVLLCIANWFRPIALLFVIVLAAYHIIYHRRDALRRILLIASGYAVTICAIGTETWSRTGYFVYQSESFWFNMADDAYDGASPRTVFGEPLIKKGTPRYIEDMESKNCFECSDIWRDRCLPWLLTHKVEYLSKVPWRLYDMFYNDADNMAAFITKAEKYGTVRATLTVPYRSLFKASTHLTRYQRLCVLAMLCYYIIMLSAIAGALMLARCRNWHALFLPALVIVLVTVGTVLLMHGETRFKAPFMPYVFMLAGYAWQQAAALLASRWGNKKTKAITQTTI